MSFRPCAGHIDAVASVVFWGRSEIPPIDTMRCPSSTVGWSFMYQDSSARWGKWRAVEIKSAIELRFGRQTGVDARRTHEIQSCSRLRNQTTPKVHGKSGVKTGEAGNEVAFPGVDGFFGGIGAVHVGRG